MSDLDFELVEIPEEKNVMYDDIDRLITDIVQQAAMVTQTVEWDKPIVQWKSYPKMRQAVQDLIKKGAR